MLAGLVVVCLYVDDFLVTRNNKNEISAFKGEMMTEFDMADLGLISYFLGIEFKVTYRGTVLHQCKYA